MSDLPIIKLGGGYVVDVTSLEAGDTVIFRSSVWPHNFSNILISQPYQRMDTVDKDIYIGKVSSKPSQGIQINSVYEPRVIVFKKEQS